MKANWLSSFDREKKTNKIINQNLFCFSSIFQVSASGNFELQILEMSNTNSHLLSGYCCGVPLSIRNTKTTGCPQCATAFRLCLREYQQNTQQSAPGVLNGCSFGNVTSGIIGDSSFVLSDLSLTKAGSLVLPFTFRWTVSWFVIHYNHRLPFVPIISILNNSLLLILFCSFNPYKLQTYMYIVDIFQY